MNNTEQTNKNTRDSSGFYKVRDDFLKFAPNRVVSKTLDLTRSQKDTYEYPQNGWYWFETEQEARKFFNLPEEDSQAGSKSGAATS